MCRLAVVTIDTIDDEPMEDFGIRLYAALQMLATPKTNQGIVDVSSSKTVKAPRTRPRHRSFLTDGFSGTVLRAMRPHCAPASTGRRFLMGCIDGGRKSRKAKGSSLTANASRPVQRRTAQPVRRGFPFALLILLGFFVLIWLLGGARRTWRAGRWRWRRQPAARNARGQHARRGPRRRRKAWGGGGFGGGSAAVAASVVLAAAMPAAAAPAATGNFWRGNVDR